MCVFIRMQEQVVLGHALWGNISRIRCSEGVLKQTVPIVGRAKVPLQYKRLLNAQKRQLE